MFWTCTAAVGCLWLALLEPALLAGTSGGEHWSFVAPQRPPVPQGTGAGWARTPIDRFILDRMESKELAPSPQADRRTLIRRLCFDLTGLPPQPEQVRAFLADASPRAYESAVDRLLASEHYGEHMARFWLDAARYADTHGLHLDNYREMWPYRDWVIRAFNHNVPYDQFVTEQLAGDLLPGATLSQQVATGFLRCHVTTNEGGSIEEEVHIRNVVDRTSTTGTVLLGLTMGCAVCHDHKYDPITQREFYELSAYFNSLDGPSMDGNVKDPAPTVRVPAPQQKAALAELRGKIDQLVSDRQRRFRESEGQFVKWLAQRVRYAIAESSDSELDLAKGLIVHCPLDETGGRHVANTAGKASGRVVGEPRWVEGRLAGALEIAADSYVDLGKLAKLKEDRPFSFGAWIRVPLGVSGAVLAKMNAVSNMRGYELLVEGSRVVVMLSSRWPGYAVKATTAGDVLKPDKWHHVFVTYDGSVTAAGLQVFVDGRQREVNVNSDSLKAKGSIGIGKPLRLGQRDGQLPLTGGRIDDVRFYQRQLADSEVQALYLGARLPAILAKAGSDWTDKEVDALRQYYFIRHDKTYHKLTARLDALRQQLRSQEAKVATTLVFRERREPRDAYLLIRGQYDQRGEKVERQTPAALPPMADQLPNDRLGLAKWIVDADHPLTSRVAVNRIWQQMFGVGLVKTSEDFGTQGSRPSHPELLDWLAVEFRETGWDVKALVKRIVMSAAYRQSSRVTPELVSIDPENRLLARGPRFRLDAEMLRDQALAVSGLLVRTVGGPSVKPPQPGGLWFAVGYSGSNTVRFAQDVGANKVHRRSLYTFWKRTSPPPQMSTFDAPSRESCTLRRERTNTPLQALLLMNDPQYVEAARRLAERIVTEAPPSSRDRARWAFETVTMRPPSEEEVEELLTAQRDFQAVYRNDINAAEQLIAIGETPPDPTLDPADLATWTMVANVILNLDEVVTKE